MAELLGPAFKKETVAPVSNFVRITNQIDQLLSEKDAQTYEKRIGELIQARVAELTASAPDVKLVSVMKRKPHEGFILPEAEVKGNFMYAGFHMDDPKIYSTLLSGLKEMKSTPGWKDMNIKALAVPAVNYAVAAYFGNYEVSDEQVKQNAAHYMDLENPGSIQDLEGKRIAVCAERAATSQNLFAFLGLDSELAMANCQIDPNQKEKVHAYNIISGENGRFIFDPTNPVVNRDSDGQLAYRPATYKISDQQYQSLQNHQAIEVTHVNTNFSGGEQREETSTRIYNA